jgi:hypothetical protein
MADAIDDLFDKAEEEGNADQWDFDENPVIKGILVGVGVAPGREYGPYFVLRIKEEKSSTTYGIPVWGVVFDNQVSDAAPKIGSPIGVKYEGLKSNKEGSREYKSWVVVSPEADHPAWHELYARKAGSTRAPMAVPNATNGSDTDFF